jgi:hypothetical protein
VAGKCTKPKAFARSVAAKAADKTRLIMPGNVWATGRCDVQVLDENWNIVETITNEDLKPMV